MAKKVIEPRLLKGFRDYLPKTAIAREEMIRTIKEVFVSFGFVPIDTPAIEYADILLGKGSAETDKQLYRFLDNGKRDVALRFDLTVPLARYVAMHMHELGRPFRRYHVAPVWRAEKPQRGRYREFIQCDFDILGTKSPIADAEILAVVYFSLCALGINHRIRLNNRAILNGLLTSLDAEDKTTAVLRAIDKLEKQGIDAVEAELAGESQLSSQAINRILSFVSLSKETASQDELMERLDVTFANNPKALQGIADVRTVLNVLEGYGIAQDSVVLDLSIARGLDYYTGTVFETELIDLPKIGSICSGGRYDNLASLYTSQSIPGVGGSIGLDRILGAHEELGKITNSASTASVLVTVMGKDDTKYSARIAQLLREAGFATELFPDTTKLGNQLKYASRKGIGIAIIAGEAERNLGTCNVKLLETGKQHESISIDQLPEFLSKLSD